MVCCYLSISYQKHQVECKKNYIYNNSNTKLSIKNNYIYMLLLIRISKVQCLAIAFHRLLDIGYKHTTNNKTKNKMHRLI